MRLRTARATAGGPPAVGPDLPGVAADAGAFALASSPVARTLLVWSTETGLQARVDGEAPRVVDATTRVSRPAASITDDGAAVIAYGSSSREMVIVDRAAGGDWAIPHVLATGAPDTDAYGASSDDQQVPYTLVQAGGRAVVAWAATSEGTLGVSAAAGQAGGAWAPRRPCLRSRAMRARSASRCLVQALRAWSGMSRVVVFSGRCSTRPRRHGRADRDRDPAAAAGADADRAARRRGARALLGGLRRALGRRERPGHRWARRSHPCGGQAATLRLPRVREFERTLVLEPRARLIRFELLVSDRAGNRVRRTRAVRVRVIERPLLSLRVALDHSFEMNSAAGNRLVALLVNDLITRAAARRDGQEALQRRFRRGIVAIRRAGHREIDRERVRIAIHQALELPLSPAYADINLTTHSAGGVKNPAPHSERN